MSYDRTLIESGWSFTQTSSTNIKVDKEEWHQCASFPTSVQAELTKSGKIPHFHKGLNEWEIQWIAEADWRFQNKFEVTQEQLERAIVDLVLEGLDTYCDVSLNGHHIAYTDNMFLHHRFEVKGKLRVGQNDLVLQFKAPMTEARRLQEANGGPRKSWNGDPARMYSRKAQYGWGWDWGPIVMTVGPWRHIALESYNYRLKDVRIDTTLSGAKYDEASISLQYEVHPIPPKSDDFLLEWSIRQRSAKSDEIYSASSAVSPSALEHQFKQKEVQPWWPVGYGKQPLYEVDIRLVSKGKEHARVTKTVGFRDVKVIQEPLEGQPGTSFVFQVNGVRIFAGGSNWIPGDNLLTEMPAERYRKWVELLIEGNQNMLRVWGGGIYEHQALYDTCDELGVLVWQDFMFGCGLYPSYKEINASIKVEAEQNVELLRDHPSVVIFAGNNEDYTVAESEKVMDYNDNSGDYMKTKFPARQIYEVILPEVVERLSSIHYHRSSPYGGESSNDPTVGDIHQWNVWHGTQEPWANWDKLAGRFVSEFGMQGYPNMRTVEEWDDDKAQLFPQSRVSVNHNKADGFERRLELYLMENFRHAMDMPSYVYYTQAMQAECLAAAYRLWRRNWKGRGKEYTSGALVWQINDCWPCVSWAIADYYLRPKPAFYSIARELRPYTVGMTRKDIKTFKVKDTFALFEIHQEIQLWGCNSSLEPKAVQIELEAFDLDKGSLGVETYDKTLEPNASTEIWKGDVPGQLVRTTDGQVPKPIVVQARLKDSATGEILARYSNWPEPWKYLIFPDPGLSIDVDGDKVTLNCKKPIKGLVLDVEGDEAKWSDQAIDLFPGDTQVVTAAGLKGRKVLARYIGDGSA